MKVTRELKLEMANKCGTFYQFIKFETSNSFDASSAELLTLER